ncbi:MAG: NUDIX domain-containing protein [Bacteroidota bacterium]
MISIKLIEAETVPDPDLSYVVLGTRYGDQWIFVRHKDRHSWEMPAGHIESGEAADEAAARELREETGAVLFKLKPVSDYSVTEDHKHGFGRLYYAEVHELTDQLEYEIEELHFSTGLPAVLTYPEVQTLFFERLEAYIRQG